MDLIIREQVEGTPALSRRKWLNNLTVMARDAWRGRQERTKELKADLAVTRY